MSKQAVKFVTYTSIPMYWTACTYWSIYIYSFISTCCSSTNSWPSPVMLASLVAVPLVGCAAALCGFYAFLLATIAAVLSLAGLLSVLIILMKLNSGLKCRRLVRGREAVEQYCSRVDSLLRLLTDAVKYLQEMETLAKGYTRSACVVKYGGTVNPVYKDHPMDRVVVVFVDRWSLCRDAIALLSWFLNRSEYHVVPELPVNVLNRSCLFQQLFFMIQKQPK